MGLMRNSGFSIVKDRIMDNRIAGKNKFDVYNLIG